MALDPVKRRQSRVRAWLPTVAVLFVFGLGLLTGRWTALFPMARQIRVAKHQYTLGRLAPKGVARQRRAPAYYDPERAYREMDDYVWAGPTIPAPFVGAVPRPGHEFNSTINSLQMRSAREVEMPKPPGVYRVFLTGGSTAFGAGAPSQDRTIGGYLEKGLNEELGKQTGRKYEVFVFANAAWVSTHERIGIENRLTELQPDLVVSFSGNNDALFGYLGRNSLWMRAHIDQQFYDVLKKAYATAGGETLVDAADHPGKPMDVAGVAARLGKNVRLATHALSLVGARYAFALQPTAAVSTKQLSPRERENLDKVDPKSRAYFSGAFAAMRQALGEIHADNFTWLDLSDIFRGHGAGEEIFLDSYHFGDRGNDLIAKALVEQLRPLLAGSNRGAVATGH